MSLRPLNPTRGGRAQQSVFYKLLSWSCWLSYLKFENSFSRIKKSCLSPSGLLVNIWESLLPSVESATTLLSNTGASMVVTSGYESRWGNLSVREIGLGMRVLFCPGKVFGFWWLFVLSFNLLHVRGFHMRQKRSQPTTWVHEAAGTSLRALACKSSALLTELSPSPPAV